MIEAYLDETGIHDNSAHCVIAGYHGGRGQWRRFEKDWKRALADFGVDLADFHALDLVKGRKAFFQFSKREALLDSLAAIIASYKKIHPVSVGLVVQDFLSLPLVQRRFFTGATVLNGRVKTSGCPNRPYFLPFQTCTRIAASYAPVGGKCHFFFGLDRYFSKYATSLYQVIKKSPRPDETRESLGDISFPLAKTTPQLQAADLLAYLTFQKVSEGGLGTAATGHLEMCLTNMRLAADHRYFDADGLRLSLEEANDKFGGFEGSEPLTEFDHEEEDDLPE